MKIEEMKMEMKKRGFEFSREKIVKSVEKVRVKLPKLKIIKCEGTALDWFWFVYGEFRKQLSLDSVWNCEIVLHYVVMK